MTTATTSQRLRGLPLPYLVVALLVCSVLGFSRALPAGADEGPLSLAAVDVAIEPGCVYYQNVGYSVDVAADVSWDLQADVGRAGAEGSASDSVSGTGPETGQLNLYLCSDLDGPGQYSVQALLTSFDEDFTALPDASASAIFTLGDGVGPTTTPTPTATPTPTGTLTPTAPPATDSPTSAPTPVPTPTNTSTIPMPTATPTTPGVRSNARTLTFRDPRGDVAGGADLRLVKVRTENGTVRVTTQHRNLTDRTSGKVLAFLDVKGSARGPDLVVVARLNGDVRVAGANGWRPRGATPVGCGVTMRQRLAAESVAYTLTPGCLAGSSPVRVAIKAVTGGQKDWAPAARTYSRWVSRA